jgi:hypothetical protein
MRCWQDGVILPALLYRFWRLTLQVRVEEKMVAVKTHAALALFSDLFSPPAER